MNQICDIIVLTWNKLEVIKSFIESFLVHTKLSCRLIIIDNASSDGTSQFLTTLKDTQNCKFKIVINEENKGFVEGMNQGISLSQAPYVCLANNDLTFSDGWLEEVLSVFQKDPRIGLLNPNSNNLGTNLEKNQTITDLAKKLRSAYSGVFAELPFCIGFCMFIRREVIAKVGGLSQEFAPFFFEDTDYSLKAQNAGFLIGMAKGSYVWHAEGTSFKLIESKKEDFFAKNKAIFTKKWGRILRIVFVKKNEKAVLNLLEEAVGLARNGNYVTILAKGVRQSLSDYFQLKKMPQHYGVSLLKIFCFFDVIGKIIFKKKRYDVVITENKLIGFVLRMFGYRVWNNLDANLLKQLKFSSF